MTNQIAHHNRLMPALRILVSASFSPTSGGGFIAVHLVPGPGSSATPGSNCRSRGGHWIVTEVVVGGRGPSFQHRVDRT